jgi:uncharacterized protein (TIRG00374 family)
MDRRLLLRKILPTAALSLLFLVLVLGVDWGGMYRTVRAANPYFIVLAVAVTLLRFMLWAHKWQRTLFPLARIPFLKVFAILMTGIFLNQTTPGRETGGEPVRAYYVSKFTGLKKRQVMATIILDKSGNYMALGTFIGFSLLFITLFMRVPPSVKVILEGILLFLAIALLSAVYVRKNLRLPVLPAGILERIYYFSPLKKVRERFSTYTAFEDYVMERVGEFVTTLEDLLKRRENVRTNLLLSFAVWSLVFVKTYLIFLALGTSPNPLMVVAVETTSILLGILSFLPGGVGATEVTMVVLFSTAGIPVGTATAVTVISRGIYYAFSLGLGYVCLLYLKFL